MKDILFLLSLILLSFFAQGQDCDEYIKTGLQGNKYYLKSVEGMQVKDINGMGAMLINLSTLNDSTILLNIGVVNLNDCADTKLEFLFVDQEEKTIHGLDNKDCESSVNILLGAGYKGKERLQLFCKKKVKAIRGKNGGKFVHVILDEEQAKTLQQTLLCLQNEM